MSKFLIGGSIVALGGVVTFLLLNSLVIVDIRPLEIKEEITPSAEAKGKTLLQQAALHHGLSAWEEIETWTVDYRAIWKIPVAWMANHWPENDQKVKFEAIANSFDSQATMMEGQYLGEVWGIQAWRTYTIQPNQCPVFRPNASLAFGNPTVHYFIELPFRLIHAPIIAYAGQKTVNDQRYHLVFATWKQAEANANSDQYLVYINAENQQIELVEYTAREQFNFLNSSVTYEGYQRISGILLPSVFYNRIPYIPSLTFHRGEFSHWQLNEINPSELRPDTSLQIIGDEKPY